MFDLSFQIESVAPIAHAAAPNLAFRLAITETSPGNGGGYSASRMRVTPHSLHPGATPHFPTIPETAATAIQSVLLKCQIRIEPTRRRYQAEKPERLLDMFGPPDRWSKTMRSMLWTYVQTFVPAFTGSTTVDIAVPCSFDFNVAATKYLAAMEEGEIPLCFLFSGTVFYQAEDGALQVAPIALDKQADFRLPVAAWKEMMGQYYPHSAWLCLDRDVFDRLLSYKAGNGLPTWERAIESLLAHETRQVAS